MFLRPQVRAWADRAGACGQLDFWRRELWWCPPTIWPLALGASESLLSRLMHGEWGGGAEEGMGRAGFRMMTLTTKILQVLEVALAIQ